MAEELEVVASALRFDGHTIRPIPGLHVIAAIALEVASLHGDGVMHALFFLLLFFPLLERLVRPGF